jgi:hypothetical protein
LEGGLALMEDKLKEHVTGLELGTVFVLCGNSAGTSTYPALPC